MKSQQANFLNIFLNYFVFQLRTMSLSYIVFSTAIIIEAFLDRFFIIFFIFSHLRRSQTIHCDFFDFRSNEYYNKTKWENTWK